MKPEFIALGFLWYIAFLFSLTCHEASHALVARWGGDLTAAEGGQVTLNPLPHIRREIFGTVIVPILSYVLGGWMIGWGSAPYDPRWRYQYPRRAAWMALAGPAGEPCSGALSSAGDPHWNFRWRVGAAGISPLHASGRCGTPRASGGGGDPSQYHLLAESPACAFQLAPHSTSGRPRGDLFVFLREFCPPLHQGNGQSFPGHDRPVGRLENLWVPLRSPFLVGVELSVPRRRVSVICNGPGNLQVPKSPQTSGAARVNRVNFSLGGQNVTSTH